MMIYFSIQGQVAVVSGATGVLCQSMCHLLADEGAKVAALGRRREPVENLAAGLGVVQLA